MRSPGTCSILATGGLPFSPVRRRFPPRKSAARQRWLEIDRESLHTLIFYESPYRLLAFLQDALAVYGDRRCAVANDLTKKFETMYRGTLSSVMEQLAGDKLLGEYSVVIAGADN